MMQSALFAVFFWLLLLPALWGSGSLAGFRLREQTLLFSGILRIGLGLAVYAHLLIFSGLFNQFNSWIIFVILAFALAISGKKLIEFFRWLKNSFTFLFEEKGGFAIFFQWSLIAVLLFTLSLCFLPEISNDALSIQLYLAKLFAKNASFTPSYLDIASYRPLLMNVFYASGMLFKNVAISKLFHWLCGLLLMLTLVIKIEESTHSKKTAFFFGLMLWLTPTMLNQITTTYIDAGVSLFVVLGYFMTVGKMKDLKPSDFFYGGLFIGMAVAARYLAMAAFFSIMIMLALRLFVRAERKRAFIAGIYLSLGVFATSGFWFLRAWIFTGNPVYPYLGSLFGTEDFSLFSSIYFHGMGLPRSVWTFLGLPLDITFRPRYFDYHHWVGPFYLLILPFAAYAAVKIKSARPHLLFALLFTTFWYFTGQNVRYLLPTLPIYLLAGAMGVSAFQKTANRQLLILKLLKISAVLLTMSLLSLSVYHFRYQFRPLLRVWSMEKYLEKMERTIPVARWMNQHLPLASKILVLEEPRLFYFDRAVVLDYDFDVRTKYKSVQTPGEMARILKDNGITHVLDMAPLVTTNVLRNRPMDLLLADTVLARKETSLESQNIQDLRYVYTLYTLN